MTLSHFLNSFWVIKMGTLKTIRAFMCWCKVGAVERKRVRERNTKRDRDTVRSRDGSKGHANYGPSLPVSIPTLGDSFAQIYVAQIAQIVQALFAQNPAHVK